MNTFEYDTDEHKIEGGSVRLFGASITWRSKRDYEYGGWRCVAVLSGNIPPEPKVECQGNGCWSRRRCDACYAHEAWADDILRCVRNVTDWDLYGYYSGPGRRFAHSPTVYSRGSRVKVAWSGGLDI